MNERSDIDRVLRHWFEDGPATMPDRVVDVVAHRISVRPQRRSWRLLGRSSMSPMLKYGAAAAAVLVIAVVGYNLLPRNGVGGPGPSPTAVPTPTITPTAAAVACDNGTAGCLGRLAGGTYSSANFKPTLTYTVPVAAGASPVESWVNTTDLSRTYALVPPGGGSFTFQVISEIAIPEQTPDCTAKAKVGAGTSVAAWVDYLTTHPGLTAEAPVPITIGGLSGFSVRFARAASWTATCPFSLGPAIELFIHPGVEGGGVRIVDDQQETFSFLDVAGETVLIIVESGPIAAAHAADVATAQPIIDTFRFAPR